MTPEIRRLFADAPGCHLHNHYGPTEAHVVTAHELDGPPETWPAAVPIGRPLSNVHIEILNDDRQRVTEEMPGELHIGGDCLARGYRGRPDLTAERFVDDPFRPGSRLYRTGDRARWRPDGTLEFLGRLDDQVKLSGYRVEPGEIEAVIAECPGVRQAVVMVREDRPGDKRLVGYYVASAAGAVTPGALQAQLRQRLPRYMLPAALVELTVLPLSPNGKVDRLALPRPATDRAARDAPAPPSDAVEASLVALWSDVLGCTGIGVDDNFFDLGGHSILAATMLLRAEQALGRAPGLNVLFEGPTIRQLAHAFRGESSQSARMVLTWITDAASGEDRNRPPLIVMPSMFGAVAEWRTFFRGRDVDRADLWPRAPQPSVLLDGRTDDAGDCGPLRRGALAGPLQPALPLDRSLLRRPPGVRARAAARCGWPPAQFNRDRGHTDDGRSSKHPLARSALDGGERARLGEERAADLRGGGPRSSNPEPVAIPGAGPRTRSRRDLRRLAVSGRISTPPVR